MDRGIVTATDPSTGREIYGRQRIAPDTGTFSASPWSYNGKIFAISEDGETFVMQTGPQFKLLGRNPLNEMTLATPAIANGSLFIRTATKLYRITTVAPAARSDRGTVSERMPGELRATEHYFPRSLATGPSTPFGNCSSASWSVSRTSRFSATSLRFKLAISSSAAGWPYRLWQLVGIVHEIEQLPLILVPEIDQFVGLRADAVMGPGVVVSGIVVVAIVHRGPPVGRCTPAQHWQQAPPLHVRVWPHQPPRGTWARSRCSAPSRRSACRAESPPATARGTACGSTPRT